MTVVSDLSDLKGKMKLILSQVASSEVNYTFLDATFSLRAFADYATVRSGRSPEIRIADPADVEMKNEQVLLLKTLYAQCNPELQTSFPSFLLEEMREMNAAVIVHTILELGHLSELKKLLDNPKKLTMKMRRYVWQAIGQKVAMESHRFTDDDLNQLDAMRTADVKRTAPRAKRPRPNSVI